MSGFEVVEEVGMRNGPRSLCIALPNCHAESSVCRMISHTLKDGKKAIYVECLPIYKHHLYLLFIPSIRDVPFHSMNSCSHADVLGAACVGVGKRYEW